MLVGSDYNALGFSVGGHLVVLAESQTTFTYNFIIRALLYPSQTYHEYFSRTKQNQYGSKKLIVPKPEIYMVSESVKLNF